VIGDLKPYAEYKESGLSWLGEVPSHWMMLPAFGAFKPNKARNIGMKEKTVLSLSYGRIVIKPAEKLHGLAPESFETYQIVDPGDIVLRTTDLQNDHTSLRVGMVRDRGIITSAYLALRCLSGVSPDYGFQFLNVWDTSKAIYGYGSGLRQNLDFSHFERMPIPIPPPAEQAAIVRFLDWANGRLERAIRAKRKVIALLNEQKQAIIHRAVTRGLDPSVPLKDSGAPWLGDIPMHWVVRRLRTSISDCISGLWGADPDGKSDITCVRVADFDRNNLRVSLLRKTTRAIPEAARARRLLQSGDLLLEKSGGGDKQPVGAVVIYEDNEPAVCSNFVARMPIANGHHSGFVNYLHCALYARRINVPSIKQTTGIQNLDWKSYLSEMVAFPPAAEQRDISDFLDFERERFADAISRLEREITLLREYRTRLVADVVSGKLDVREAAAGLPKEEPLTDDALSYPYDQDDAEDSLEGESFPSEEE